MIIKLDVQMYHSYMAMLAEHIVDGSNNDVNICKNMSKLWIAVTS